jgi:pimeloyl-ACP methyl ester carboxylesterase
MGTADMAADLEALRKHLDVPNVSVLGHSNGGAIALSYAEQFRQSVSRLILIDSQVLGFNASDETQRILQQRSTDPRFEAAVKNISAFFAQQVSPGASDEALESFVGSILPLYLYKPESTLALAAQILSGPISSYAFTTQSSSDASNGTDQVAALDRVTARTLILVGRHDFICPVPISQRLRQGTVRTCHFRGERSFSMAGRSRQILDGAGLLSSSLLKSRILFNLLLTQDTRRTLLEMFVVANVPPRKVGNWKVRMSR